MSFQLTEDRMRQHERCLPSTCPRPSTPSAPSISSLITLDNDMDMDRTAPAAAASNDTSTLSSLPSDIDSSSPLSSLASSRVSTPEFLKMEQPSVANLKRSPYLSPPSTQGSSRASPSPNDPSSGSSSSNEDGERPHKRRRIDPSMPRDTRRLDFDDLKDPEQKKELDRLVKALKTRKKIVVVAGAGISVSAGIPDFRSANGLFQTVKAENKLKGSGKGLFSADVYRDDQGTTQFHSMVRSLHRDTTSARPTAFHHLIARLAQEDRLLRLYTQNVDGIDVGMKPLETQVPLPRKAPWPKAIQLHGGLSKMVCSKCSTLSDFDPELFDGPEAPDCENCLQIDYTRTEIAGKRSHGVGRLRPRMVLYEETNPDDEAIGLCVKADWRRRPDCVIVVGTTLKIPGVKTIVSQICKIVKGHRDGLAVWVNNDSEPPGSKEDWDILAKGTSDQVAEHAQLGRWDDEDHNEFKVLSQEEVKDLAGMAKPAVVIQTPTKANRFKDIGLQSPIRTPKLEARDTKPIPVVAALGPSKPSWLKTIMNDSEDDVEQEPSQRPPQQSVSSVHPQQMLNPASRGRKLNNVIPPIRDKGRPRKAALAKTSAAAKPPASKPAATNKKAPAGSDPRSKAKSIPAPDGQLDFPIAKANPANAKVPKDKAKILTTSPTRENMPRPSWTYPTKVAGTK